MPDVASKLPAYPMLIGACNPMPDARLQVLLCDAVCGVGRLYCEKVVHGINLPADVRQPRIIILLLLFSHV